MEIHAVQILVLVKARKDVGHFAGVRIALWLQALGADFFHHALHGRVDGADGEVVRLHMRLEHVVACARHRRHHAVRADDDEAVGVLQADRGWAKPARGIGLHGLHDIADEAQILWPAGREAGQFIAAPDDDVGRRLDVLHLVAVDDFFVAGEVEHLRSGGAEGLADGKQHGVTQAATHQRHRLVGSDVGGCAGRAHQHHRLAGPQQGAEVG